MNKEVLTLDWLTESQADWHRICELLQAAQYERAAELLCEAQQKNEHMGRTMIAEILAAMRFLCRACSQCRAEVAWHERAHEKAGRRERELKQQLQAILDLLEPGGSAAGAALARPQSHAAHLPEQEAQVSAGRGWRMQNPLRWDFPPSKREVLAGLANIAVQLAHMADAPKVAPKPEDTFGFAIHCLGPFRVYRNGQLITDWNSLKGQAIFKYLLTHQGAFITKDILMAVFWPEADPEAARRNLHQAIYSLRQTLKQNQPDFQPIQFDNDCYFLNPAISFWVDCQQFERHVQTGQRLETAGCLAEAMAEYGLAEQLYRGDFLEEDLYEDWASLHREHWRNIYLDLADRLSEHYLKHGDVAAAMTLCEKILALDNCNEQAHRRLMQCYQTQGQRHMAVRQYRQCVQTLKTELDVPPDEQTQSLYKKITGSRRNLVLAS
ncbi:MAG: winged helix-turn-helix domain-containing protein [Chloroflexi bacterium]|nr:winged helix-turn-helix domain-containing protein [Chloroflexota bacterium]